MKKDIKIKVKGNCNVVVLYEQGSDAPIAHAVFKNGMDTVKYSANKGAKLIVRGFHANEQELKNYEETGKIRGTQTVSHVYNIGF